LLAKVLKFSGPRPRLSSRGVHH